MPSTPGLRNVWVAERLHERFVLEDLDTRLIEAWTDGRMSEVIGIYAQAADVVESIDAAAFYRTQAYILALEAGDPRATEFHSALKRDGREL